jgi:ribosomal-protein-alanine N-acetyltransferase
VTTIASETGAPARIREATRADLLAVFRIERSSFAQPWPYGAFEHFLGQPGFLVADDGGANGVVGYLIGDLVSNGGREIGHIKDIAVAPDHRGRAVPSRAPGRGDRGRRRCLAGQPCAAGWRCNDGAIGLYRAFGFGHHRTIRGYYQDGEDALIMVKDVTDGPRQG